MRGKITGATLAFLLGALGFSRPAWAGFLLSPSLKWQNISFDPRGSAQAPNYYSYGLGLEAGYSLQRVLDIAAVAQYLPARAAFPGRLGADDADFMALSGEVGIRLAGSIYIGARVGKCYYHLIKQTQLQDVTGMRLGTGATLVLGGFMPAGRQSYWQASLEITRAPVMSDAGGDHRALEAFGLSAAYVFNSFHNFGIENTIFKSFLDTLLWDW